MTTVLRIFAVRRLRRGGVFVLRPPSHAPPNGFIVPPLEARLGTPAIQSGADTVPLCLVTVGTYIWEVAGGRSFELCEVGL